MDGKMLSIRHRDYNSDGPKDFWCTFGGGVDDCEPLLTALEREVVEETVIKLQHNFIAFYVSISLTNIKRRHTC